MDIFGLTVEEYKEASEVSVIGEIRETGKEFLKTTRFHLVFSLCKIQRVRSTIIIIYKIAKSCLCIAVPLLAKN